MTAHAGTGHGASGHAVSPGLAPRERSAPQPSSTTAAPPQPLIAPTGSVALDGLAHLVNRAAEPWQDLPNQTPIQKVATVVNGVLGIINMDVAVDAFNLGVGALSSLLPSVPLPAAVLGMPHIGTPHTHLHPPSLVPPAPPIPLPSIGTVAVGGCISVLIGGMPAARAGDLGLALTCGTLAPPFEIAVGSSSVFIGGSRAARMTDMTKHCGAAMPSEFSAIGAGFSAAVGLLNAAAAPDAAAAAMAVAQTAVDAAKMAVAALMGTDPGVPPCLGAVMMGIPNVLIGGFPIPPIENFARAFFQKLMKPLSSALHSIVGKSLGKGRLANFFHELVCHTTGHPVDVANGRVLTSAVDLQLPGPIPLVFKRQYASSWSDRDSVLGWGWSHSFDQAVWVETGRHGREAKVVYRAEDGREIEFDLEPGPESPPWLKPNERWDRFNRLTLRSLGKSSWEIEGPEGLTREFAPVPVDRPGRLGRPPSLAGDLDRSRLQRIRDRSGNEIRLRYDQNGNLDTIVDSGSREIRLEHDRAGRLKRVMVPHPTQNGWMEQARYGHSSTGDLTEAFDPLGHVVRLAYDGHLLVRETNRNGLSFHFAYQGAGPDARCVKTWGDGGIYERVLVYDAQNRVTFSTDSYGHTTTYQMNADNAVVAVRDPRGGIAKYGFDDCYRKVSEVSPVGAETRWEYDQRGNCTKVTDPDGAELSYEFNELGQVVRVIDAMKGEWRWGYDRHGLIIGRVDPLNNTMQFNWSYDVEGEPHRARPDVRSSQRSAQARPPRLTGVTDPAGHQILMRYDRAANLVYHRTPDGVERRWDYDNLGRCIAETDGKGNVERRDYDAAGRLVRVREIDGNVRDLEYDPEGQILHARDSQHDVAFVYQGMGRVRSRTEAGTAIHLEYDREERLVAITNEQGRAYRFELGPTGDVETERGFDGLERRYVYDLDGRVTKIVRPDHRHTEFDYDLAGRVVAVSYEDGGRDEFVYRADGELVLAKNNDASVVFERDLLGRAVKEVVADNWIASEYDVFGMRVRVRSSKGLDQRIHRNAVGDVIGVRAASSTSRAGALWELKVKRDALSLEVERSMPGVQVRWDRNAVGRPIKQEVLTAGEFRSAVQYTWAANDRLQMVVDAARGPTRYQHDGFGNLAAAARPDGTVQWRLPDAVGNLFRTGDRSDRVYGPAGQLLEARRFDGGVTRCEYDAEGNLTKKTEVEISGGQDRTWTYRWSSAGMLKRVERPDGQVVDFTYDPLGRRVSKTFQESTTRWIWDGDVMLHEWVDGADEPGKVGISGAAFETTLDELSARRRRAEVAAHPALGPPPQEARGTGPDWSGTPSVPITWLFQDDGFVPIAKFVGDAHYAIVSDHLGTPTEMYDTSGAVVWSARADVYGQLIELTGSRAACPFRWPGQYEDVETGLYYNRLRYYDSDAGEYISQDPIGLLGGLALYGYVSDPLSWMDPYGLAACPPSPDAIVLGQNMPERIIPAARKIKANWLKGGKRGWSWGKNVAFIEHHIAQVKAGTGRILDIGFQKDRYHGRNAIYSKEAALLKQHGLVRKPTGDTITTSDGHRYKVYEWVEP